MCHANGPALWLPALAISPRPLASSSASLTPALHLAGTHPSLARTADGARWPTAVLAYDADTRQLKPTQLGAALPRGLFTVSLEEARAALAAAVPAEAAAADLSSPAMAALAAELGGILALLQRLPADAAVAPLLADGQSDVFSVSLAALAPLKSDAAARRLVDAALPKILAAFSGAWGGAASRVHLILAPADTDVHVDMAEGWTLLGAHAFAPAAVSHEAKLAACGKLAAAVEGSSIVAHCLAATGGDRRRLAAESPSVRHGAAQRRACTRAPRARGATQRPAPPLTRALRLRPLLRSPTRATSSSSSR